MPLKRRICLQTEVIHRLSVFVKNQFDDAKAFVNRIEQTAITRLAHLPRRLGPAPARLFPAQADQQQQQRETAQRAGQQKRLNRLAAVRLALDDAVFKSCVSCACAWATSRRIWSMAWFAGLRHQQLAGSLPSFVLAQRNARFDIGEFRCGQRHERGEPLLRSGIVCCQAAKFRQPDGEGFQTFLVRRQVVRVPGEDEAALPGFRVLQAGQQFTEFLDHHAGMGFQSFRIGCGLHVSIRQPAYARQAAEDKHQQGFDQQAFAEGGHDFTGQAGGNARTARAAPCLVHLRTRRGHAGILARRKAFVIACGLSRRGHNWP